MENLKTTQAQPRQLNREFLGFTGTTTYYKYSGLFPHHLTDGTKHIGDKLGLYWFFDTILSYQSKPKARALHLQTWKLRRITEGKDLGKWEVILIENKFTLIRQLFNRIILEDGYEDKFDVFTVYISENVVFLPSEY